LSSLGLRGEWLGGPIAPRVETLERLSDQYGLNACGEGGEYESLAVDCPLLFSTYSLSISPEAYHIVIHDDNGDTHNQSNTQAQALARCESGLVAYLRFHPQDVLVCRKSDEQKFFVRWSVCSPPNISDEHNKILPNVHTCLLPTLVSSASSTTSITLEHPVVFLTLPEGYYEKVQGVQVTM